MKTILVFQIAENQRTRKPVYLDGDIRRTFLRKGGGDYKAQMQDIERLLRDATADRWDSQPFERVLLKEAFRPGSLRWYRDRFHQANPGLDPAQTDQEFLYHWGFLLRQGKRFVPTRAAIMLFGSSLAVHQILLRPTLDVQFLGYRTGDVMPETRWIDRIVCEDNIIQAWEQLVTKYRFFMPKLDKEVDMASDLIKAMFGGTAPAGVELGTDRVPSPFRQRSRRSFSRRPSRPPTYKRS